MTRVLLLCVFLLLTGCGGQETDPRPIPAAWSADVEVISGTGTATVEERLERDGESSVVVYRSARESEVLACGDLQPTI